MFKNLASMIVLYGTSFKTTAVSLCQKQKAIRYTVKQ